MSDRYEQRTYLEIKAILVSMYRVLGYCYSNRVPFQSVPYLISRTKSPKTVSVNLMNRVKSQGASGSNQASHAIDALIGIVDPEDEIALSQQYFWQFTELMGCSFTESSETIP